MSASDGALLDSDGARHWGVALFDPRTGRIAHIQRVTCLADAPDLTPEQVVDRAHVHAAHAGHDLSRLRAIQLAPDHDYRVPHVVDLSTGAVAPAPPRPASSP